MSAAEDVEAVQGRGGLGHTFDGGSGDPRIHVLWSDVRSGRCEILASWSADCGRTWSEPRTVNDDAPRADPPGGPDDFMPAVAVNGEGIVGATWYDRREQPDNAGYDVRFSASLDGGETWLPSCRVSEQPNTVPAAGARQAGFHLTGGDTAGLAAGADGAFHALWIDNRTGVQQVWTARIVVRR